MHCMGVRNEGSWGHTDIRSLPFTPHIQLTVSLTDQYASDDHDDDDDDEYEMK
jgi:hypothetical protein